MRHCKKDEDELLRTEGIGWFQGTEKADISIRAPAKGKDDLPPARSPGRALGSQGSQGHRLQEQKCNVFVV